MVIGDYVTPLQVHRKAPVSHEMLILGRKYYIRNTVTKRNMHCFCSGIFNPFYYTVASQRPTHAPYFRDALVLIITSWPDP